MSPLPADYVQVNERIVAFYERHPEGSIVTEDVRYCEWGDQRGILCSAVVYRAPTDPNPGRGYAWEPFPGKTNFTRDSEVQNAETSAWGRALASIGIEVKRGIATKDDVDRRVSERGVERVPDPGLPAAPLVSEASAERIIELGSRLKGLVGEDAARAAYVEARDAVAPAGSALLEEHAVRIITSLELALSLAEGSADTPPADRVTVVAPGSDGPSVPTPPVAPKPVSKAQRGVLDKLREELVGLRGGPRADEVWFELLSVQGVQSVDELSSVQAGEMEASLRLEVRQAAEFVPPPVVQQALTEKAS